MLTVMSMEWSGITQDQYNQVMRNLDLDKTPPKDAIFHVAGFVGGTLRILDIWDSQQAFERFQKDRLTVAAQKAGITSPPRLQFYPVHNIYAPNLEIIRKFGSSALPIAA